jgi:hypothetical protein
MSFAEHPCFAALQQNGFVNIEFCFDSITNVGKISRVVSILAHFSPPGSDYSDPFQLSTILAVAEQLRGNGDSEGAECSRPAFVWVLRDMQLKMVRHLILKHENFRVSEYLIIPFRLFSWRRLKKLDPKSEMVRPGI